MKLRFQRLWEHHSYSSVFSFAIGSYLVTQESNSALLVLKGLLALGQISTCIFILLFTHLITHS